MKRPSLPLALLVLAVLLWSEPAWAWGPAAHVHFGLQALAAGAAIAPALRRLLQRHREDYLYGCVAADIIVGKNAAPHQHHCHNWENALRLLHQARGERQEALVYGVVAHLAADTVSHNYFVPFQSVVSFRHLAAKHTYWELRYDGVAHGHDGVFDTVRDLGRRPFSDHHEFLGQELAHASRLFSFPTSRRIFRSAIRLAGTDGWRRSLARLEQLSRYPIEQAAVRDYGDLATAATVDALAHLDRSRTVRLADPIGRASLRASRQVRGALRDLARAGRFDTHRWTEAQAAFRACFRESIYGACEVPDVEALVGRRRTLRA